jgi:flavin-dependent dehydrogenase
MPVTTPERRFDAVVLGGGPAGSAAARLLGSWGHDVLLVTKPQQKDRSLGESLPPSCRKLLDEIGVLDAVDGAHFIETSGNTVWWGGGDPQTEFFPDRQRGYQVLRTKFDRVLFDCARAAGAAVMSDAVVRDVDVPGFSNDAAGAFDDRRTATVRFETNGVVRMVRARWVLDCTGRAGIIARRGLRRSDDERRTVALLGIWKRSQGWGLPDESHTLVESYTDGWAWSVPTSDTERFFTVMVDPELTDLLRGERVEAMYRAELDKTSHLRGLLDGANMSGAPWGCDASLYAAHRYAGDGFLLVGDAASFIDPLSSFGVKKALASAWLAAIVVNTALGNPAMGQVAVEFFDTRERRMHESYQHLTREFFRSAESEHGHAFWAERGVGDSDPTRVDTGESDYWDIAALRKDPDVLGAFQRLREASAISLARASDVRTVRRPAVRNHRIELEEQLDKFGVHSPLRFLRDVDVVRLVAMAADHDQVPDLFEAYNRLGRPASLPDFLGALSALIAKGVLVGR